MNLASCQVQNQEGWVQRCTTGPVVPRGHVLKSWLMPTPPDEKVPQQMGTQSSTGEEQGMSEHRGALHQPRASP